jgi:hypothetical protein
MNVLAGVSSSPKKISTGLHGLDVHETKTEARKSMEAKAKEEMRRLEKEQIAEREAKKKQQLAEKQKPDGWVMEVASKKPAPVAAPNQSTLFTSASKQPTVVNPPSRHAHSLEQVPFDDISFLILIASSHKST